MEIHLSPEQEARVAELAARGGRSAEEILQEAVNRFLDEDRAFIDAVMKGLAALDRGEYVSHEEVGRRINQLFTA